MTLATVQASTSPGHDNAETWYQLEYRKDFGTQPIIRFGVTAQLPTQAERIAEAALNLWQQPGPIDRPRRLSRAERAARRFDRRRATLARLRRLPGWLLGVLAGTLIGALFVATEPLPWLASVWRWLRDLVGLG